MCCSTRRTSASRFVSAVSDRLLCINSYKNERIFSDEQRHSVEEKVRTIARRLGITKEIEVVEIQDSYMGPAAAGGNASLPGRAIIVLDPNLFSSMSEGEQEFMLAHEIVHIKHHDSLKALLISLVTPLAIVSIIGYVVILYFDKWKEERADKVGFSVCSPEGQRAATAIFERLLERNLTLRNQENPMKRFIYRIVISQEGENRLNLSHPPLRKRIRYLRAMLST